MPADLRHCASFSFICSICFSSARFSSAQFVPDACRAMQRASLLELVEDRFAGDGFDAAHAGRDAAFVDDLAQADVAGAADVRAAAQLLAEAGDGDDAHPVAVLFAEQSHGAGVERLVEIHDVGVDLDVLQDLLVDEPLDFRPALRDRWRRNA